MELLKTFGTVQNDFNKDVTGFRVIQATITGGTILLLSLRFVKTKL